MANSKMYRSAPVLQVADVIKSAEFYTEKLGFETAGFWGEPPCFSIVGHDTVMIFLDQSRDGGATPVNQYWAAYVYVEDADGLCDEYRAKGVEIVRGPEDAPYGCRDFDVRDPDGHLVCFGQDLQPTPAGPGL
jgi:catechol 2,3-dioxygenase-like lactoylglutathione lyase family enzyme